MKKGVGVFTLTPHFYTNFISTAWLGISADEYQAYIKGYKTIPAATKTTGTLTPN